MKKIATILCACLLVLALPMTAFAAGNSTTSVSKTATQNGVAFTITGVNANMDGFHADAVSTSASNVPSGTSVLASFRTYYDNGSITIDPAMTGSLALGSEYANHYVTLYVQYDDGTFDVINTQTDANGNVKLSGITKTGTVSIVIGGKISTSTDTSSTSPKTGMDFTGAAAVAGIAILGAGAAFTARRKLSE